MVILKNPLPKLLTINQFAKIIQNKFQQILYILIDRILFVLQNQIKQNNSVIKQKEYQGIIKMSQYLSTKQQIEENNKENDFYQVYQGVKTVKFFSTAEDKKNDTRHKTNKIEAMHPFNEKTNQTAGANLKVKIKTNQSKIDSLQIVQKYDKIQVLERLSIHNQKKEVKQNKLILSSVKIPQSEPNQKQSPSIKFQKNEFRKLQLLQAQKVKKSEQIGGHRSQNQTSEGIVKKQLNQAEKFQRVYPQNSKIQVANQHMLDSGLPTVFSQCSHIMKQIKQNYKMQHIFNRHSSCAFAQPVIFQIPKTNGDETLTAQRTSRFLRSQFNLFLNKKGKPYLLGTLKSNFSGSIYNFYPRDTDMIYFSIVFNIKKNKVFRSSEIYINRNIGGILSEGDNQFIPYNKMDSLEGLYTLNSQTGGKGSIFRACSKQPTWSQAHRVYHLGFGTHVMPSAKNAIFVNDQQEQVMKFYKNSHHTYDICFQNPFSWIVSYGYVLASTDFKWATQ